MLWKVLAIIFIADYIERVILVPVFQKFFWKRHPEAKAIHYNSIKMAAEIALASIEDEEETSEGD